MIYDAYPHVYGGAQRIDHLLATALPERGWDVELMVPATGPLTERLAADGTPVTVVVAPAALGHYGRTTRGLRLLGALVRLPGYWLRLALALRRRRPDVVHVIDHRGLVLALLPARLAARRVVWHVHAVDRSRLLNRLGARLAHEVLVPSAAVLGPMPDLGRRRLAVVVPGVVAEELRDLEPGPLEAEPLVVTVARLHPDKGVDVLLDALALVRAEVPGARLTVIGAAQDGVLNVQQALSEQVERLGLGGAVTFRGFVDRPAETVAASRLYVQPSRSETFGLAVLEALALGVTVVATDVGGVGELLLGGEAGLLVAPDDPEALANAMVAVLTDDDLAERLRTAGQARAADPAFTASGLVDAVVAVYEGGRHGG